MSTRLSAGRVPAIYAFIKAHQHLKKHIYKTRELAIADISAGVSVPG